MAADKEVINPDATILLSILQQIYSLQNHFYTIIGVDRQVGDQGCV